jgi:hypothetical protein
VYEHATSPRVADERGVHACSTCALMSCVMNAGDGAHRGLE